MDQSSHLREDLRAFGDWLNTFQWDSFATLTFGEKWGVDGPSPDSAFRVGKSWIESLPHRPGYYLCVERGRLGRTHLHGLIQPGGSHVPRKALWRGWHDRFGRARLEAYDSDLGAHYYVAKYLNKSPLHWDVGRLK